MDSLENYIHTLVAVASYARCLPRLDINPPQFQILETSDLFKDTPS